MLRKLQDYIFESKVDGLACVGDEIDVSTAWAHLIKALEQNLKEHCKEILIQLIMC
jgi:hypothetical protein